jgi:23S rRNA pseudouridine2605 synthase
MQRLSKIVARAGIASRRKVEEIIQEGRVTVNGKKILIPQEMVDPEKDIIFVDGKKITTRPLFRYFVLNKPRGFLCTNDPEVKKKAVDLLGLPPSIRLFTIGRLDKDTEGLLLITNDGNFAHRLMHPSFETEKEYLAKVDKELSHEHLAALSEGCFVEGSFVRPTKVQKVRKGTVRISVVDGKKHEIRELVQHAGGTVLTLRRIRIGALLLGNLAIGDSYELTEETVKKLFPNAFIDS